MRWLLMKVQLICWWLGNAAAVWYGWCWFGECLYRSVESLFHLASKAGLVKVQPSRQWRTEGMGGGLRVQTPPPRYSEGSPKSCQTQPDCENCWKLLNLGRQHPKMFGKKAVKFLKLPSVRNCFTLAMTNKLVVTINSLKVPKFKNILLYEMKFLVPNYSCLQNPWLGGYRPQTTVLSVLNWICWTPPPRTKFLGTPLRRENYLRLSVAWIFSVMQFNWLNIHQVNRI